MQPTFLRSITTVHTRDAAALDEAFWRNLLPNWTFLQHYQTGDTDERLEGIVSRLNPDAMARARRGELLLLQDVDRPQPNECLISLHPDTGEITIRIFGRFLTDIQSTSEWFIHQLLERQEHFVITPHTRCFIALDVQGERTDLTTGRVLPQRHRLWQGFYRENSYNINITVTVLLLTLLVLLLGTPTEPYSLESKFYGICERVLSAAIMNSFLMLGQFYSYRRSRRVVEWEKP